jgi:hypothetical protein
MKRKCQTVAQREPSAGTLATAALAYISNSWIAFVTWFGMHLSAFVAGGNVFQWLMTLNTMVFKDGHSHVTLNTMVFKLNVK